MLAVGEGGAAPPSTPGAPGAPGAPLAVGVMVDLISSLPPLLPPQPVSSAKTAARARIDARMSLRAFTVLLLGAWRFHRHGWRGTRWPGTRPLPPRSPVWPS